MRDVLDLCAALHLHDVDALVLSPGPGLPRESGALLDVIADHFGRTPILGVCLGMQALAEFTGGRLVHTGTPRHGIARPITWTEAWAGGVALPNPMMVGLYHSWAVDSERLSPDWSVTATDFEGLPAAMRHGSAQVWAVQFHPEVYHSTEGKKMIKNFLVDICGCSQNWTPAVRLIVAELVGTGRISILHEVASSFCQEVGEIRACSSEDIFGTVLEDLISFFIQRSYIINLRCEFFVFAWVDISDSVENLFQILCFVKRVGK